ncbi:hypothetical protein AX774_g7160 [Zancudomyces culisetae]|uniref:Oxidoreductase-like domain-containing protein n=1 Tax=Zancudomyces culisetae TaxID=1213189 RepID=A0A1R1PEM9_ZANCU|nr:hypothetical protein AX774_g7160 [Zancudomyces culisetae]|eukprot:OMH79427.1 hypothetical protein AX774_g7160 [Zancudomyces culisetae]
MCCMSACKNCVWNIYDLDLAKFQAEARNLRTEFLRQGINENQIPKMLNEAELQSEIDPSIEAFNALIRKLNE